MFELAFVGVLMHLYTAEQMEATRVEHAKKVSDTITQLLKETVGAFKAADDNALLRPGFDTNLIRQRIAEINRQYEGLRQLCLDDARQSAILDECAPALKEMEGAVLEIGDVYDHFGPAEVQHSLGTHRKHIQHQLQIVGASQLLGMAQEQQDQVDRSPEVQAGYRRSVLIVLFIAIVFNVSLTIVLAIFFSRGITRRIATLVDNSARLAQGKPLHNVMKGADEIAHLDQVFHSMADALAEAERSKQEMIGMVTHDLKTPLTTVSALLEMLEDGMFGALNEQGLTNLKVVSRNVSRMNGLIRDLLDIEKIKSGKLALFQEDVGVRDLLEEAAESVRSLAADRQIEIIVNADEVDVYADNQRMQQILINLLSNAIKFSPEKSQIILAGKRDGALVHFTVQDFGRGIPADKLSAVFERFEQTKVTDATVKGGTGLGLAICKALVELHGGQIGVTSQEGKGSTFFFAIPVAKDIEETSPAEATIKA
jgi:signal transduction histidine kinase